MVVTKKGYMARLVAKFRPNVPVSATCMVNGRRLASLRTLQHLKSSSRIRYNHCSVFGVGWHDSSEQRPRES